MGRSLFPLKPVSQYRFPSLEHLSKPRDDLAKSGEAVRGNPQHYWGLFLSGNQTQKSHPATALSAVIINYSSLRVVPRPNTIPRTPL